MQSSQNATIHNRFDIEVRDAKTNELKQNAVAYNNILNQWFNSLCKTGGINYECTALSYIGVGTGTGTLDPTRTNFFSYLGRKTPTTVETLYQYPISYITKEIRLEADEYNGNTITEVGFYNYRYSSNYYLATHAFLQDSEGNQIAINKTDTDVIIIRGTFYVTFNCSGFGDNGIYPQPQENGVIKWLFGISSFPSTFSFSRYTLQSPYEMYVKKHGVKTTSIDGCTRNPSLWRIDYPLFTWGTEKDKHTIKTIGSNDFGAISLPNSTFFPPLQITKTAIGTGDGISTEFNIKAPFIVPNSETIYVDNVAQVKGVDYEIDYENNFCDMHENYHSAAFTARMENINFGNLKTATKYSTNYRDPIAWWDCYESNEYPVSFTITEAKPIYIDFLEPKECNRMKIEIQTVASSQLDNMKIQYSEDDVVWTDVSGMSRTNQVWSFDLTTARYWRVYIPSYSWSYSLVASSTPTRDEQAFGTSFFLGKTVPGLKFLSPPANGAIIEASYQIDRPYKTPNNILRFTCSLVFERGEGS
ncbi:MAG: hypothetical protein PHE51_02005 [Eubacteriales bacterium]|nr:hypothetical protein [Eubacteriales bacterium]